MVIRLHRCLAIPAAVKLPDIPKYNQLSQSLIPLVYRPIGWLIWARTLHSSLQQLPGHSDYSLKSIEKYSREHKTQEKPSKKYFPSTKLREIIMNYPLSKADMKPEEIEMEYDKPGMLC